MEHRDIPASQNHGIVRWYYTTTGDMSAATVSASDVGKLAQVGVGDAAVFYALVGASPNVYKRLGSEPAVPYVTDFDFAAGQLTITLSDSSTLSVLGVAESATVAAITAALGAAGGIATLDGSGQLVQQVPVANLVGVIDTANLPSYVDDVLEYANLAAFPVTGETGKIYLAQDTGASYRWTGSVYIKLSDDDVLEFANLAAFPASGVGAALYIAADTGLVYRWNGSAYSSMGLSAIPSMTALANTTGGSAIPAAVVINGAGGLAAYDHTVQITGAQSIAGVKTFTDQAVFPAGSLATPAILLGAGTKKGFYVYNTDGVSIVGGNVDLLQLDTGRATFRSFVSVKIGTKGAQLSSAEAASPGAQTGLGVEKGTTAALWAVYGTLSGSNYERVIIYGGPFPGIGTDALGTGTVRDFYISTGPNYQWLFRASGGAIVPTVNGSKNIGEANFRVKDVYRLGRTFNSDKATYTPVTGATVTIGENNFHLIDPAGALAALTINPPTGVDGQELEIVITQAITAITWGAQVLGAPTSTAGYKGMCFRYIASTNKWYYLG